MKSTFRVLFYLKRDKQKADGTFPVMCRVTIDGQASRFNTKVSVSPDIWDSKAHLATGKSNEAREINRLLNDIRTSVHNVYHELLTRENTASAQKVKNIFLGLEVKNQTILEVFRLHNENFAKLVGISKSIQTYKKYELVRKRLESFIREEYHASDIALKDINHMFLHNFEIYLMTTFNCKENTTGKFLQRFRTIIIMAKNNGWIKKDPFANFKIKYKKTDRGYLTQEEIDKMMRKEFASKRLEQVRDVFVFCCYTGLAYIDVKSLDRSKIRTSFDGRLWIMDKREKTDISFNVPLLTVAKEIIDKYSSTQPEGMLLPVTSNQKMNEYLKEIATLCGIDKVLTFHMSRHTFATLALTKGVSIESVSKMLGHTNIKTTQIYARVIDTKISKDMASFEKDLELRHLESQSNLDASFENLSLREKLILFNLPNTLLNDPGSLVRLSSMWHGLSKEDKSYTFKSYVNYKKYISYKTRVG